MEIWVSFMLKEKLKQLNVELKYLKKEFWDEEGDITPKLLTEEKIENHFEGEILSIDNGKAELAYIEIFGRIWFVSYGWIPLYSPYCSSQCLSKEHMMGKEYFGTPYGDEQDKNEKKGRKALEAIGFQTASFEGF